MPNPLESAKESLNKWKFDFRSLSERL